MSDKMNYPYNALIEILDTEFASQYPSIKVIGKPKPTDSYINASRIARKEIGDSNDGALYLEVRSMLESQIERCKYTSYDKLPHTYREITRYIRDYLETLGHRHLSMRWRQVIQKMLTSM